MWILISAIAQAIREGVEHCFPSLRAAPYSVTSPPSDDYNCIGWAAGDDARWWWPDIDSYWPPQVTLADSPEAFSEAFETLGYRRCASAVLEPGVEKVAIFAKEGRAKHAARQLPTGEWTSKLGNWIDISHPVDGLSNSDAYGSLVAFMARPRQ